MCIVSIGTFHHSFWRILNYRLGTKNEKYIFVLPYRLPPNCKIKLTIFNVPKRGNKLNNLFPISYFLSRFIVFVNQVLVFMINDFIDKIQAYHFSHLYFSFYHIVTCTQLKPHELKWNRTATDNESKEIWNRTMLVYICTYYTHFDCERVFGGDSKSEIDEKLIEWY